MISKSFHLLALALVSALSAVPLIAQATRDSARTDSIRRLAPVVTTATRAPVSAELVARRLDVLSRATLEQASYLDAADLLKKEAGADVIQFGGLLSGVGLRGFRPQYSGISQRTLLLVDGRPAGVTNAALLDLGDAERVEVLRGPASALYGSSAMGGVINIISRRRTGRPGATIRAGAGSFGSRDLRAEGGGALWSAPDGRQLDADVSVRHVAQTSDYRVGSGSLFRDLVGAGEAIQVSGNEVLGPVPDVGDGERRDNTTFAYQAGSARAGWAFGNGLRTDLRADLLAADDIESPGNIHFSDTPFPGNSRKNQRRWSSDLSMSGTYGVHAPMLRAYYAEEASEYFDSPGDGRFVNYVTDVFTRGVQLQDAIALGSNVMVGGLDFTRTDADSRRLAAPGEAAAPYTPNSAQSSLAGFAEFRWQALDGRLSGTFGARADRVSLELKETTLRPDVLAGTERFDIVTPSAALLARVGGGLSVRTSIGRAFVAPDAFAKAGLTTTMEGDGRVAFAAGNPALDPERSLTVDGGLVFTSPSWGLEADAGYFHTTVRDRITPAIATFSETDAPLTPDGMRVARVETRINAARATLRGYEARLSWDAGMALQRDWSLRFHLGGTRLVEAEERVPAVTIDASRLADRENFTPEQTMDALVLGDETVIPVKNVSRTTVNAGVEWSDIDRFRARISGRYSGKRRDLDYVTFTNDVLHPAFLVADVSFGARLTRELRADLLVSNVTDENYYEVRGYNLPGRSFSMRLTAAF